MKREIALLLIFFLLAGTLVTDIPQVEAAADSGTAQVTRYQTGLMKPQITYIPYKEEEQRTTSGVASRTVGTAVYKSAWDAYSSNFYYNQMSTEQKRVWDALDKLCRTYMTSKKNCDEYLDYVFSTKLTRAQMINVALMFRYSNPQYFFLDNRHGWTKIYDYEKNENKYGVTLGVYSAFRSGSNRSRAIKKVKEQVDAWKKEIKNCKTDYDKVKKLHDLICSKVEYNYDYYGGLDEDTMYTQTVYSVFCKDETVCAGYSQAFEMMCNGVGVDATVVTSTGHEWNRVRLNDSWYNVDLTWDDAGEDYDRSIIYTWFLKSDKYFQDDYQGRTEHYPESIWKGYMPKCTLNSTATHDDAGKLPKIKNKVATPKVSVTKSGSKYKVTIQCSTKGAKIYYTLDGKKPGPNYSRSYIYKKAFTMKPTQKLRVVAVTNKYKNSNLVTVQWYTVKYQLNGGKNNSKNPTSFTNATSTITLKKPTRSGYEFKGWYTNSKFKASSKITQIKKGTAKNLKLYAKWKKK